jgi:hypothetical protein
VPDWFAQGQIQGNRFVSGYDLRDGHSADEAIIVSGVWRLPGTFFYRQDAKRAKDLSGEDRGWKMEDGAESQSAAFARFNTILHPQSSILA